MMKGAEIEILDGLSDLMMTTSEKISLISAFAAVLQALVVTVTLIYIYRQTAALRSTADDLDRGARLSSYTNLRSNIHKINKLLLKHDSLAESLGFSERDLLAFIIMNYFELVYLQKLYGVLDENTWKAQENMLSKNMKHPFIKRIWSTNKDELHPEFVKYVEEKYPEMGSLNPAPFQFSRRRRKNRKRAYSSNKRT